MSVPVRGQAEITHPLGLHLRAAGKLVGMANRFESDIRVVFRGREVNGKSILDLMTLVAECGSVLVIEAEGPDAGAAVAAFVALIEAGFDETGDGFLGR
jgi:phosphocarrier protein HPr